MVFIGQIEMKLRKIKLPSPMKWKFCFGTLASGFFSGFLSRWCYILMFIAVKERLFSENKFNTNGDMFERH